MEQGARRRRAVDLAGAAALAAAIVLAAGGGAAQDATSTAVAPYAPGADLGGLRGRVADGSSTVWP